VGLVMMSQYPLETCTPTTVLKHHFEGPSISLPKVSPFIEILLFGPLKKNNYRELDNLNLFDA